MGNPAYPPPLNHLVINTIWILLAFSSGLQAACNNPSNWLQPPGSNTKLFIGYNQEQPRGFDSRQIDMENGYDNVPNPLPADMLEKSWTGTLPTEYAGEYFAYGGISFYEPDGKGNWRLCRIDFWGGHRPDETYQSIRRYMVNNPVMLALNQQTGNVPLRSRLYFYDANGRLQRTEESDFEKPDQPAKIISCRRYDHKGRLTDLFWPDVTQVCPQGEPDVRDSWHRVRYAPYDKKIHEDAYQRDDGDVIVLDEGHSGTYEDLTKGIRKVGQWKKSISFKINAGDHSVMGNADADYINGVTKIWGSSTGKLDDNAANTALNYDNRWWGSNYDFMEQPIPLAVIKNPDLIYKYHRRRMSLIDGDAVKMYEGFKPGEHIPHHRMYFTGGYFSRHEQLNAQGKVTRVITMGGWKQRYPGSHPDVDDKLLSRSDWFMNPLLWLHKIYFRVYELDENGKPTLVALSWNKEFFIPEWVSSFDFSEQVAYGTPDGKVRWKNLAEFEKAFDTSLKGTMLFPDEQKGYKKPQVSQPEPIGTPGLD